MALCIVVTGKISQEAVEQMRVKHRVLTWDEAAPIPRDELMCLVKGADAIVSLLTEKVFGIISVIILIVEYIT